VVGRHYANCIVFQTGDLRQQLHGLQGLDY